MNLKLFILLIFVSILRSQYLGCTLFENSYYFLENDTSTGNVTIDVTAFERRGLVGIGFSPTNRTEDITLLFYYQNDVLTFFNHSNLQNYTPKFYNSITIYQDYIYIVDNLIRFKLNVPYNLISNSKYVILRRMLGKTEKYYHEGYVKWKESHIYSKKDNFDRGWCEKTYLGSGGRLSSNYYFTMFIAGPIYIILLILSVYFRNDPPVKARGLGPQVVIMSMLVNCVVDSIMTHYVPYEQQYSINCFVSAFILYPSFQLMIIIPFLHFFRYIVLLNVSFHKQQIVISNKQKFEKKLPLLLKILNKLTTPSVIILFPLFYILFYCCVIIGVFAIFNFKCGGTLQSTVRYIHVAFSSSFTICVLFFQILDIIMHRNLVFRCRFRKYFIQSDYYLFRLEYSLSPFASLFAILWVTVTNPSLFRVIILEILYFILIMMGGLLSLLITIYFYIKSFIFENRKNSTPLLTVFQSDELFDLFLQYAQSEWSVENVYFKISVDQYKKSSKEKRFQYAKEMIMEFFNSNSVFELNIPLIIKEKVLNCFTSTKNLPPDLFYDVEKEVEGNLNDTLSRFMLTYEYKAWVGKQNLLQK